MNPGELRIDPTSQFAALQERVYGLGQQFQQFEQATTRGFQQMETGLAALSAEVRAGGKTQWQTIISSVGVLVAVLGALGALAYLPIRNGMAQLSNDTRLLRESVVPRQEITDRWRRTDDEIRSLDAAILRNADRIVPRGEHEEKWRSAEARATAIQREIDELKRVSLDAYASREAVASLSRRLELVEHPQATARQVR